MIGENYIRFSGFIENTFFNEYANNVRLCIVKLAIPIDDNNQYMTVKAWGDMAEEINMLTKGTFLKLDCRAVNNDFEVKCKFCKHASKKYDVDFIIDNFIVENKYEMY